MTPQAISERIITLCQNPDTALQAIHLFLQHGKAQSSALSAIYQRVMTDGDVDGAYYLAVLALQVDDLPFDGKPLVDLVMQKGEESAKQALLAKLPAEFSMQSH